MKKSKSLVLSIPKPCSENWDKMTPSEKGRYCSNCEKVVTDLTQYTNKQLLDFISNSKGRICGKLSPMQLNREIVSYEPGNSSFLQRLLVGTALATALSACNESGSSVSTQQTEQHPISGQDKQENSPISNTNPVIEKVKEDTGKLKDTLVKSKPSSHKKTDVDTEISIAGMIVPAHFPDSNASIHGELSKKQYKDLNDYVSKNMNYPDGLSNIGGTVYVGFIVEKSGEISGVHVLRGIHPAFDSEAVRVIRAMPNWSSGKQNGQPVRVQYMLPIHFKPADDSDKAKTN